MKFKVGDKVRVVRNETNTRAVIGDIGIIKGIKETFPMYAVEFPILRTQYHECQGLCGCDRGYWCGEGMLELVEKKPNECIVIYRKDSDVIALDKRTGKKAVAKCSPDDEFDFNIGAKLAFERLGERRYRIVKQDKYEVGEKVKFVDKCSTGIDNDFIGKVLAIEDVRIGLITRYYKVKVKHRKEGFSKIWWLTDRWIEGKVVEINESDEIKVGDYVKVVNRGKLHTTYTEKVKELSEGNADVMTKFRYGNELDDNIGEYVLKHKMEVYAKERGYCLLRDINGGYILIDELGIEKCE